MARLSAIGKAARLTALAGFFGTLLMASHALAAQGVDFNAIRFGNRDARLVVEAGATMPRVRQLKPAAGEALEGDAENPLVASATIDGKTSRLHWQLDREASRIEEKSLALVYRDAGSRLALTWEWQARSEHGPLEHTIRIENRGQREIWIALQDSFTFRWKAGARALQQLWVDKGAGKAPPVGTHLVDVGEGYRWRGESSAFAHPRKGEPREIIPYFLVRPKGEASAGWYLGVEFSGRIAMTLARRGDTIEGSAGLNPEPGPFRTRLAPGGAFVAPTVLLGATRGSIDDAGNVLKRWIREAINDPRTRRDPSYPWTTNNSWGSAMAISDAQARRMIDDAAGLGFEMFHLDAGWFRAVGDWRPDPQKFPQGLASLADHAHGRGLKFGLWVDWAQAGTSKEQGALDVVDPAIRDWLTTDPPPGFKPGEFKGLTIDVGVPAAKAWVAKEVDRLVREYKLDMLEHDGYVVAQGCDRADHEHATCDPKRVKKYTDEGFIWMDGPNSSDVSYHAARAYYDIHDGLRRDHPDLLLEVCNDGGRMVDFGSAAHADYFSIVDSYDPVSNRQAFYDASHVLPPAMLETYVKEWPASRIENFRYMLRSGMMGWFSLMLDTTTWNKQQHDVARAELDFYKTTLRPLIREADLYHVGPRADGKGWDGIEYFDASRGRGVLYAFRGNAPGTEKYTFSLRGLDARRNYRLSFRDRSSADITRSGGEWMQDGVSVNLPRPDSSELVLIEAM
ncbi:alpha-galactosidase [Rudaea sp.]|uniref:alpha-galactosidase n=1 Tax=Rudaea sp. TaxID=2136325 RepID=UPI0032203EE1